MFRCDIIYVTADSVRIADVAFLVQTLKLLSFTADELSSSKLRKTASFWLHTTGHGTRYFRCFRTYYTCNSASSRLYNLVKYLYIHVCVLVHNRILSTPGPNLTSLFLTSVVYVLFGVQVEMSSAAVALHSHHASVWLSNSCVVISGGLDSRGQPSTGVHLLHVTTQDGGASFQGHMTKLELQTPIIGRCVYRQKSILF